MRVDMSLVIQLAFDKLAAARTDEEFRAAVDTVQAVQRLEKLKGAKQ